MDESGDEILFCFSGSSSDQIEVAKLLRKKLKEREKLREEITRKDKVKKN
jgi:20S proteasome alpha/beta subunit